MTFDESFDFLMEVEGEYSNNPEDPGGETMYGITKRTALRHGYTGDMKQLPLALAKTIAKVEYWDCVRGDELPDHLRYPMFDAAYNSGPERAVEWLQRALDVEDDGVFGPLTMAAALLSSLAVPGVMLGHRLEFMTNLRTWSTFGKGWTRRIAKILKKGA